MLLFELNKGLFKILAAASFPAWRFRCVLTVGISLIQMIGRKDETGQAAGA